MRSTWASRATRWLAATVAAAWCATRSWSATANGRPASAATTAAAMDSAWGHEAPTANQAPRSRSAPTSGSGSDARGWIAARCAWGARTSVPSDPERWATTTSSRGAMSAATAAIAASGVATTTRSTPSAASAVAPPWRTGSATAQPAMASARARAPPARPGPTMRARSEIGDTTGSARSAPGTASDVTGGVGDRHDFRCRDGQRIGVVSHHTGRREVVVYDARDPDAAAASVVLDPAESRTLAELLGGTTVTEHV